MSESGNCTSIINLTYKEGAEGSPSNPAKFNNQDYAQLKDQCRLGGKLFLDNTFPPENQSLGDLPDLSSWEEAQVVWLRPGEILQAQNRDEEPVFCENGASRFDFAQGAVGNCWFLAAISSLTFHKSLMVQVAPLDQSFEEYRGIFHFRFWRFGKWVDVVIDDHLPTINNQLVSVHSKGGNEFWIPLLEKAYAKVCGSYADMHAGLPSEACKDFSGGVHKAYVLRDAHDYGHDEELWLSLQSATRCNSMICCGTSQRGDRMVNSVAHTGLVDAHAYSVTGVTQVTSNGSTVKLVRLFNPWGRQEWNGNWSDKSRMWSTVEEKDKELCSDRDDGEFWMELDDFCFYFETLFICCENPNFIDRDLTCQWKCNIYEGSWIAGKTAGGNINEYTFMNNPQYRIEVPESDDWKQGEKNILISLMQKPKLANRKRNRPHPIGLTLFKLPPRTPVGRLRSLFFRRNQPVKTNQNYSYQRDLIEYHSLEPGEYVVIPSTLKPYMDADFILTVYSKHETKISPHDKDDDDGDDHDHDHKEDNLKLPETPTDKEEEKKEEETTKKDPARAIFDLYSYENKLNPRQLQRLLNDHFYKGSSNSFSMDTCRSMMAMVDTDRRIEMTFSEFSILWKKIDQYKKLFDRSDENKTRALNENELKEALKFNGVEASDHMTSALMFRFGNFSAMTMEGFIRLMIRLENVQDLYRSSDFASMLTFEQWFFVFMYN